jgi:hypothetical protein
MSKLCRRNPDLVSTKLVLPDDEQALTITGERKNLTRRRWLEFAAYCEIPRAPPSGC